MPFMNKREVTRGVYWLEIPDAELYILCACPADSVKHLMKRGFIAEVEREGTLCETGPNAILLSDALIQNGELANLAEFPVLQMLYRQGMFIPGHPGNTGTKPLLMGSASQVQAQLRYIYRGNYGLTSEWELLQTGMSKKRAREAMRIKQKFAFDSITTSDSFLDTFTIGNTLSTIRRGVSVRRLAHNTFEFVYNKEALTVDLNLPRGLTYPSPYPLNFSDSKREYFSVVHTGNGDGWDVNRPAMASIIFFQGKVYLIDAGPHIEHTLLALGISVNEIQGIFHTHGHDDHFCGLTTLMRASERIHYFATPAVRASVAQKWAALLSRPEDEFGDYFAIHDIQEGRWNMINGLEVKPVYSPHPVETTIFFFRAQSGKGYRSYAHLADIASRKVLEGFITDDVRSSGISRQHYERVWKNYLIPADIKKIDIGGGLIHGDAQDFTADKSGKIILSHTARPLTDEQKEIGSGADFGMTDTLITGQIDFIRSHASDILRKYLPGVRAFELDILLNSTIQHVSPESILLRRGEVQDSIYLILTGTVEVLDSEHNISSPLNEGAFIGERTGLAAQPAQQTFRALSHVRLLALPRKLLAEIIQTNKLKDYFDELVNRRELLRQTWLFGGTLSATVQNTIASSMLTRTYKKGEILDDTTTPVVSLLTKGTARVCFGKRPLEIIKPGDCLGEGFVLFDTPCLTRTVALEDVSVATILGETVKKIPAVRWKLFEVYKHRVECIVDSTGKTQDIFQWHKEYSTGVSMQDKEHKKLLQRANAVSQALESGNRSVLPTRLEELIEYTTEHFRNELSWYAQQGFPEYEHHARLHRTLLMEIQQKVPDLLTMKSNRNLEFLNFFRNWLIDHILTEDRKFGQYLMVRDSR